MGEWCAATVNAGGPFAIWNDLELGMGSWARDALAKQPTVVFAQEVPNEKWLSIWRYGGYTVTEGVERGWRVRSALLTRSGLDVRPLDEHDVPSLAYHGTYLAAAEWTNAPGGPITLVSVHASPNLADPQTYGWPIDQQPQPRTRSGGPDPPWVPHRLWDSDMVLATLLHIDGASGHRLIAGGDFNEARGDDRLPDGTPCEGWGHEYFDLAAEHGLVECSLDQHGEEIPTRAGLQLDHVLASSSLVAAAGPQPPAHLHPAWGSPDSARLSDHTALWLRLPL